MNDSTGLPERFEEQVETLAYIDANNLYGYAQSCPMPIGDYAWMSKEEILQIDWSKFDENAEHGYIIECDLEYPEALHFEHNSLPLAPHRMTITEADLSTYSLECLKSISGKVKHKSRKLVSSFLPRKNYVLHAANLALYIQLGMTLQNVHRVMKFRQSLFLKQYIDYCTMKRAAATSDFRKRLFKDFSNSNFGKFIENKRLHLQCKIVDNKKLFEKWVGNPRYSNFKVLSTDGITAIFLTPRNVKMTQAFAIGFSILERSKALIFSDYYTKIKPALGGQCTSLFTDTDSLCLRITAPLTWEEIMLKLSNIMDYSNYPKTHPKYSNIHANALGYWKDEMKGMAKILEWVGLASKCYSMRLLQYKNNTTEEAMEIFQSKSKGVAKAYRKRIPFEDYKRCITSITSHSVESYSIQSKNHIVRTIKSTKKCFSSFDDKRYIMPCGIHTVGYGSKYIRIVEEMNICPFCE
jgi:hypothetical protein